MLLAVYVISIKKPTGKRNLGVLTCVAMVFCPIQHILEALNVFHADHHRAPISLYTKMAADFCFPL